MARCPRRIGFRRRRQVPAGVRAALAAPFRHVVKLRSSFGVAFGAPQQGRDVKAVRRGSEWTDSLPDGRRYGLDADRRWRFAGAPHPASAISSTVAGNPRLRPRVDFPTTRFAHDSANHLGQPATPTPRRAPFSTVPIPHDDTVALGVAAGRKRREARKGGERSRSCRRCSAATSRR
jgi:hypothetical protein